MQRLGKTRLYSPRRRRSYRSECEIVGEIKGIQLAIADAAESVDHLVDPEHALRIAMARQQGEVGDCQPGASALADRPP